MQYVDKLVRITVPKVLEASFSKYELYSVNLSSISLLDFSMVGSY
jgi:hypothetical protein